ncbi:MAG: ABC transporter permease [Chloroflexota bacterium]
MHDQRRWVSWWPWITIAIIILMCFSADMLVRHDPLDLVSDPLQPPQWSNLLGTDSLGRDVFTRLLWGGRYTLVVATASAGIATVAGLLSGIVLGWSPKFVSGAGLIILNAILAVPGLVIALVIITLMGQSQHATIVAVAAAQIPQVALVIRGAVLAARSAPFILGARAIGATERRILHHHILRHIGPVVLAQAGVTFSFCMLNAAALSFLGLGELGVPDWGTMVAEGRGVLREAPWVSFFPGLVLTVTVISVNALVDRITQRRA